MKICFLAPANNYHTKNGANGLVNMGMMQCKAMPLS